MFISAFVFSFFCFFSCAVVCLTRLMNIAHLYNPSAVLIYSSAMPIAYCVFMHVNTNAISLITEFSLKNLK